MPGLRVNLLTHRNAFSSIDKVMNYVNKSAPFLMIMMMIIIIIIIIIIFHITTIKHN